MENTPVLGNFSITLPAPNGAQLQISGYMYADESKESLDERIDTMREVLVRQQQALEIPVLEERIAQLERTKGDIERAYFDLLEKQKKKTLPSAEVQHLRNYPTQIKHIDEELAKGREKIAKVRVA